jgi:hypothetical protein
MPISQKTTIALPVDVTNQYGYESNPLSPNEAKEWYKTFPAEVTSDKKSVTFIAALVAEPARWSVAHITNILLLDERSNLDDTSKAPEKQLNRQEQNKIAEGKYKSSQVYEHTSMTQTGSDPYGDTARKAINKGEYTKDKDIETNAPNLIKNVTDRDFEAINRNPSLVSGLEEYYKNNLGNQETGIIDEFSKLIKNYLGI